jgi:NAD(P)H-hydrate epimerase
MNAYIVLKGPHSLIGCPDGRVFINNSGDTEGKAGMATAGSGDVLNGMIAAMFCLGLKVEEAVRAGVFLHGLSGDLTAKKKGPDGMTAEDILNTLPNAVRYYRENLNTISIDYNEIAFVV